MNTLDNSSSPSFVYVGQLNPNARTMVGKRCSRKTKDECSHFSYQQHTSNFRRKLNWWKQLNPVQTFWKRRSMCPNNNPEKVVEQNRLITAALARRDAVQDGKCVDCTISYGNRGCKNTNVQRIAPPTQGGTCGPCANRCCYSMDVWVHSSSNLTSPHIIYSLHFAFLYWR